MSTIKGSRSLKRTRSTKSNMAVFEQRIIQAVNDNPEPMTVRGVYYRLAALTPPTETIEPYRKIQDKIKWLRESGDIPWEKIIDPSREIEFPYTWASLSDYVRSMASGYRRELWNGADERVVITLEKRALAGWVREITDAADVPLLVVGGYTSVTVLHDLAEWISDQDQDIYVYHFGDWNPSGENIRQTLEKKLHQYGASNFKLELRALTEKQIKKWHLISRPAKDSDARTPNFSGKICTDLDALSKDQLQGLVRACIEPHVDDDARVQIHQEEVAEQKRLTKYAERVIAKRR